MKQNYKEKLASINTFLFDIDGVLTDGTVWAFENELVRRFNAKDSFAMRFAIANGFRIFIITGGDSEVVRKTMLRLGCTDVILKAAHKAKAFDDLKEKYALQEENCLYVGDDLPDISLLKRVKVSVCPADAAVNVLKICDYQSLYNGGKGCVRDIIEQTMRVQGKWEIEEDYEW